MKRNLIILFFGIFSFIAGHLINCPSANAVTYARISTGGSALASSYYSSSHVAANAFDWSQSTSWISSGTCPQWLRYKLPSSRAVSAYKIYPYRNGYYAPTAWYFQGYNGSKWVTLDTRSGITSWTYGTGKTFYISNTTRYQYYRIYITSTICVWWCGWYCYTGFSELALYTHSVPLANFSASTSPINIGDSSTLNWTSSYALSASINQGIGSVSVNGSKSVTPRVSTTYKLTTVGVGGNTYKSVTIKIYAPAVEMVANSDVIVNGDPLTLAWGATNVTSVSIDNGVGSVYYNSSGIASTSGTVEVYPTTTSTCTKTYTITAVGPSGTATKSVTVTVYPDVTDSDNDGLPDYYEVYSYGDLTSHGISSGDCECE